MPTLLSIFASVISKLIGIGVDSHIEQSKAPQPHTTIPAKTMEERRLQVTLPSPSDTNEQEIIRYEYTMELVNNTKIAHRVFEYESAVTYMVEAKRVSGYHGTVKDLYNESIDLYLKDTQKLSDCDLINQKISFVKKTIPEQLERFKPLTNKCTVATVLPTPTIAATIPATVPAIIPPTITPTPSK
ncbi:MAG: hypothetical protein HQK49_07155 [Oligoflexia bacterium]|nr:hypothetical protein [Oligoflexia bacterium]